MQIDQISSTFEVENRSIAKAALNHLSDLIHLPENAIELGLTARPPCRFEQVNQRPLIIMDVAHNPDGLNQLFHAAKIHYPKDKLRLLFGLSKSKDIGACLAIMAQNGHFFYPVEAANGKCVAAQDLEKGLRDLGIAEARIFSYSSVGESVRKARQDAEKEGQILLVCGTFFIMEEVRSGFLQNYRKDKSVLIRLKA